jgi:hypothetical protein
VPAGEVVDHLERAEIAAGGPVEGNVAWTPITVVPPQGDELDLQSEVIVAGGTGGEDGAGEVIAKRSLVKLWLSRWHDVSFLPGLERVRRHTQGGMLPGAATIQDASAAVMARCPARNLGIAPGRNRLRSIAA